MINIYKMKTKMQLAMKQMSVNRSVTGSTARGSGLLHVALVGMKEDYHREDARRGTRAPEMGAVVANDNGVGFEGEGRVKVLHCAVDARFFVGVVHIAQVVNMRSLLARKQRDISSRAAQHHNAAVEVASASTESKRVEPNAITRLVETAASVQGHASSKSPRPSVSLNPHCARPQTSSFSCTA